ncbi:MAG: hypothetical protein ACFFAS_06205 [Promethearchaeota archaeon]
MESFKLKIIFINTGFSENNEVVQGLIGCHFKNNYRLNLGVNVFVKNVETKSGEIVTLAFWDVCSKPSFKFFLSSLYKGAMGVFGLIKDVRSYEIVRKQIDEIKNITKMDVPYVLVFIDNNETASLDLNNIKIQVNSEGGTLIKISEAEDRKVNDAVLELAHKIIASNMIVPN